MTAEQHKDVKPNPTAAHPQSPQNLSSTAKESPTYNEKDYTQTTPQAQTDLRRSELRRQDNRHAAQRDPRGAGSGEHAVATRGRTIGDSPADRQLTHEEHVELLLEQAEANEAYNNKVQAAVVDKNRDFPEALLHPGVVQDPLDADAADEARDAALKAFEEGEPVHSKENVEATTKLRHERDANKQKLDQQGITK